MHAALFLCATTCAALLPAWGPAGVEPVRVTVDTSDAPETAPWGKDAAALVEKWSPIIARLLPGGAAPREVRLVFKKDMKGVAHTAGRTITIAARWIKNHPDDFGMVVHELAHVIQGYPRGGPSWLVEGIADYVRFTHYEPQTRVTIDVKRASYRDGYRTTGKFLAWVETTHDTEVVRRLNDALRAGTYRPELFEARTGRSLDRLWSEFLAAEERAQRARRSGPAGPQN